MSGPGRQRNWAGRQGEIAATILDLMIDAWRAGDRNGYLAALDEFARHCPELATELRQLDTTEHWS